MSCVSINGSSTFCFGDIQIDVKGKIELCNINSDGSSISEFTYIMRNILERFVRLLKTEYNLDFSSLIVLSDVRIVDEIIENYPIYFVIFNGSYSLYMVDGREGVQIKFICEYTNLNSVTAELNNII